MGCAADAGLDFFGVRYFSAAQGRFTTVDPAFESEILEYPQTWNRYSYVYNNPLRFTDPDGRCPNCIATGVGALIGGAVEGGIDLRGQLLSKRLSDVSRGEVGAHAAAGAITGGLAGPTMGGSLLTEIGVGAVANVAGGIATHGIEPTSVEEMGDEDPFSGDDIAQDYRGCRCLDRARGCRSCPPAQPWLSSATRTKFQNEDGAV